MVFIGGSSGFRSIKSIKICCSRVLFFVFFTNFANLCKALLKVRHLISRLFSSINNYFHCWYKFVDYFLDSLRQNCKNAENNAHHNLLEPKMMSSNVLFVQPKVKIQTYSVWGHVKWTKAANPLRENPQLFFALTHYC